MVNDEIKIEFFISLYIYTPWILTISPFPGISL